MEMARQNRRLLWIVAPIVVGIFVGLVLLNSERSKFAGTEYLLDADGCKAAQRLGVEIKIDNGMCAVRAEGDQSQHLFLAGGVRISQVHVLGSRLVK